VIPEAFLLKDHSLSFRDRYRPSTSRINIWEVILIGISLLFRVRIVPQNIWLSSIKDPQWTVSGKNNIYLSPHMFTHIWNDNNKFVERHHNINSVESNLLYLVSRAGGPNYLWKWTRDRRFLWSNWAEIVDYDRSLWGYVISYNYTLLSLLPRMPSAIYDCSTNSLAFIAC